MIKSLLKYILKRYSVLFLRVNDCYNNYLEWLSLRSYKRRLFLHNGGSDERPYTDNEISVNYLWKAHGSISWNRQSAFSMFSLLGYDKKTIIELACGNGWYYREFYFWQNDLTYYGYDINEYAINNANQKLKIKEKKTKRKAYASFEVKNILENDIYNIDATHVFFYAAMSMFTKEDRIKLLKNIHMSLESNHGIFCGNSGIVMSGKQQWDKFIGLSKDENEIYDELKMFFKNVFILPREKDDDTVLFMASDGELPFYNLE